MYWTEANRDYIGKATMLGQNIQKIVATKVYQPFSITIAGLSSQTRICCLNLDLNVLQYFTNSTLQ